MSGNNINVSVPVISAFITNLGKYNEGEFIGKWHDFPTTKEEIIQTFREIGIDGANYEEFFITDYDVNIEGIYNCLLEYANIDEINYFASKISDMSDYELEIFESATELNYYCNNLQDLINLTENLDCFDYLSGIEDDYDLGYYWINESGCYDTKSMGHLYNYFDYESFGRDISFEQSGVYTPKGYIYNNGDIFSTVYDGMNIPEEYKIFAVLKAEQNPIKKPNIPNHM